MNQRPRKNRASSLRPTSRAEIGQRLREIRAQAIAEGMRLLSLDEIRAEVVRRRSGDTKESEQDRREDEK